MSIGGHWTGSWGASHTAASLHAALGGCEAFVGVVLPDDRGNLRMVASSGDGLLRGRRRSARRREAFASEREVSISVPGTGDRRLSLLPMIAGGEAVGVVEIVAPSFCLDERRDAVLALVRQSAELIRLARERVDHERTLREIRHLWSLTVDLIGAHSPIDQMTIAANALWESGRSPVMIFHRSAAGVWRLGATRGIGSRKQADFRRIIATIPGRDAKTIAAVVELAELMVRFPVEVFVAEPVALVVARSMEASPGYRETIASLLSQAAGGEMGERSERAGMGLALAAHELKGPLVGARAALDNVIEDAAEANKEALLRLIRSELENLTQLVDPLLEWAAGRGSLHIQDVDLVEVVRDAVASCLLGRSGADVLLVTPDELWVHADRAHLRTAVANLIRNAINYSPADDGVSVSVAVDGDTPTVIVRDRGPGVLPEEVDSIFEPFARGRFGRAVRSGNGLGLFVAQRVIQAHGGVIDLESSDDGASFVIRLPGSMVTDMRIVPAGARSSVLSA